MHDSIRRSIEANRGRASSVRIERIVKDVEGGKRRLAIISSHVTSELERRLSEMDTETYVGTPAPHPTDAIRERGELWTRDQMESHLVERLRLDVLGAQTTFDLTVRDGLRIFGPPYDLDWSEGNGVGAFARFDGRAFTVTKDNGFSAAGIGFYVTTTGTVSIAITPQGTYRWNWFSFANLPSVRSRGGMGLTIYADGQPQPMLSHQPTLWSVSGATAFSGDQGSGRIADAASPAFGLGTVPLAPALVQMAPGSTYLVWVWSWQIARATADAPFMAFSSFDMPLVTLDAGPPIIVH